VGGGKAEEAISLEHFWNELAVPYSFSLLCAYPIMGFQSEKDLELFVRACAQHSRVSISERYCADQEDKTSLQEDSGRADSNLSKDLLNREAELRFRLLVEAIQEHCVFMFDLQGNIRSWNPGAESMQGYKASEIIGRNISCLDAEQNLAEDKFKLKLAAAITAGSIEEDCWRARKYGSRFWANITITPATYDIGEIIGFAEITRSARISPHADGQPHQQRNCRTSWSRK
jgi:PAS domain S-box-containing protein